MSSRKKINSGQPSGLKTLMRFSTIPQTKDGTMSAEDAHTFRFGFAKKSPIHIVDLEIAMRSVFWGVVLDFPSGRAQPSDDGQ